MARSHLSFVFRLPAPYGAQPFHLFHVGKVPRTFQYTRPVWGVTVDFLRKFRMLVLFQFTRPIWGVTAGNQNGHFLPACNGTRPPCPVATRNHYLYYTADSSFCKHPFSKNVRNDLSTSFFLLFRNNFDGIDNVDNIYSPTTFCVLTICVFSIRIKLEL